jgi:hypothetical protein
MLLLIVLPFSPIGLRELKAFSKSLCLSEALTQHSFGDGSDHTEHRNTETHEHRYTRLLTFKQAHSVKMAEDRPPQTLSSPPFKV